MAVLSITAALAAACGGDGPLGPPVPAGVTDIGGPPMTSAPPPPPGWHVNEVVPRSQLEARDTILGYLRRTLGALPPNTVVDSSGFVGSGQAAWCDDEPDDPGNAPVYLQTIGDVNVPGGMDPAAIVSAVGDQWRTWGWYVIERDGFHKPNQFGYAPDGYRLQVEMSNPPSYPPTLIAISPCFPGGRTSGSTFPTVVGAR
nr:hypothetical protein [Mycolicibacterium palauense]